MKDLYKKAEEIVLLLQEKNKTTALAESCTGGLISKLITDVPGASSVFECAIVSYSNRIKSELLGVSSETLKAYGAVSEQCVQEMAAGALRLSGADFALAVSGISGPASDNTDKKVGLVYICAADRNGQFIKKLEKDCGSREKNRNMAALSALELLHKLIREETD